MKSPKLGTLRFEFLSYSLAASLAVMVSAVLVHAEFEQPKAPPQRPITLKLLGWNDETAKCKFMRDSYDKITKRGLKEDKKIRPLVMMAIGSVIQSNVEKGKLTADEQVWGRFLANPENDRLRGIEEKLDEATKKVVDELISAVSNSQKPDCEADRPFVLTAVESSAVFEKLKEELPKIAKKYENEQEKTARSKVMAEMTNLLPSKVQSVVNERSGMPAKLNPEQVKTDFALDLAVLRNKLRGYIASDSSMRHSRVRTFEPFLKQYYRDYLKVPWNRAGIRTEGQLRSFLSNSIDASVRQFVPGDLTETERAEMASWADSLTAENRSMFEYGVGFAQPQIVFLPISPVQAGQVQLIGPGRACAHPSNLRCAACAPRVDSYVVPIGVYYQSR